MFYKQEFWRRSTSYTKEQYSEVWLDELVRLLNEMGIKDIYRYKAADGYNKSLDNAAHMKEVGAPEYWSKYREFKASSVGSDSTSGSSSQNYFSHALIIKVDGVKYGIFFCLNSSYVNFTVISDMTTEENNMDFYTNYLYSRQYGMSWDYFNLFNSTTLTTTVTAIRDEANKLFLIKMSVDGSFNQTNGLFIGHTTINNYTSTENNEGLWCFPCMVFNSKKGANTKEDGFSYINPLSGFTGLDPANNLDLIGGKAYIQKALIKHNGIGITGELNEFYFHSLRGLKSSEIINLNGETFVEVGNGLLWRMRQ